MGLTLSTDERGVRVWRNDKGQYPNYSISYSKKNESGKYDNCYLSVRFSQRGVDLPNGTDILIRSAFPSFNIGNDGKKYSYWMITDFERMDGEELPDFMKIADVDGDEAPFD